MRRVGWAVLMVLNGWFSLSFAFGVVMALTRTQTRFWWVEFLLFAGLALGFAYGAKWSYRNMRDAKGLTASDAGKTLDRTISAHEPPTSNV